MAIFLLLYFIFLIFFAVIGTVGVFHAIKYRMPGDNSVKGAYIFIIVSTAILIVSFIFILKADWSVQPDVFKDNKAKINKVRSGKKK